MKGSPFSRATPFCRSRMGGCHPGRLRTPARARVCRDISQEPGKGFGVGQYQENQTEQTADNDDCVFHIISFLFLASLMHTHSSQEACNTIFPRPWPLWLIS